MRQGNDVGTQYRSAIFTSDAAQRTAAAAARTVPRGPRRRRGTGAITTEIEPAGPFYYAEAYHQQYLAANPGVLRAGGTGVSCPVGSSPRA